MKRVRQAGAIAVRGAPPDARVLIIRAKKEMFAGSLLPAPAQPGYGRAAGWSFLMAAGTLSAACVLFTSWWRITGTYFAFLWNHNRFVQSTIAGRPRRRN